jgi:uncharacterized protein (DUF1778 family)
MNAGVNIHLRARAEDKDFIDQVAGMVGLNLSQFMMMSALKEAKNILLDQTTIYMDAESFQKVIDWLDRAPTLEEMEGMERLLSAKAPWQHV